MKLDLSNMILNSDVHLISSNHNHYFFRLCKTKNENNSNSGIGKDSLGCIKTLLVTEVFKTHIELRIALFCKPPSRQGPPVDIYINSTCRLISRPQAQNFCLVRIKNCFYLSSSTYLVPYNTFYALQSQLLDHYQIVLVCFMHEILT